MSDVDNIIERLKDACNGHPHARTPWPHRVLHDAIAALESQSRVLQSFVDDQIEYMRVNELGDGEKQHNVIWARKVMVKIPESES